MKITESIIEEAALAWLESLGYLYRSSVKNAILNPLY